MGFLGSRRFSLASFCLVWRFVIVSWVAFIPFLHLPMPKSRPSARRPQNVSIPETADFAEVRDFSLQHGGLATQELSQTPTFACTIQDCEFQIWLGRPFSRPPTNQWLWQSLYPTLPYVGLRPWLVWVRLEVRSGVLMRSTTTVGQLRRGGFTIEYSVHTGRNSTPYSRPDDRSHDYVVVAPHVTGPPTEVLQAWVKQTSDAPMDQVFDVDLRCFKTVFRGCSNLSVLAPAAWQQYHHE